MNALRTVLKTSLLFSVTLLPAIKAFSQSPSYLLVSAPFNADQKTVIPGRTLDPGSYSIRIVDHLKDRFIIRVDDTTGAPVSTFIGLRTPDIDVSASKHQGPIFWNAAPKGRAAVRGFAFPNGSTLEFVYPKAEAVTLAKLNTNSVPAIDPESEGLKPDPKLSPEDREVVTLWLLTATRVGPKAETPAIAVKRFVAPAEGSASVQVASATPPPALQPKASRPAPVLIAKAESTEAPRLHSSVKRLPQTASNLPLMLLLSGLSLLTAAFLRFTRSKA